jgi:hypothetical protein
MRRLVLAARLAVTACLVLTGCVVLTGAAGCGPARPAPAALWFAPALSGSPGPDPGGPARSGPDPSGTAVRPARVRVPAIGVDAPLEELTLDAAGALQAPTRFGDAGWYAAGTVPGDVGPAVIAGHVDSRTGPAVFFRLSELRPGDLVEVARGGTWVRFQVVAVERYPKSRFPTDRVYGPTPDPQLRLITCGGVFDRARRSYLDNTVVYAVGT